MKGFFMLTLVTGLNKAVVSESRNEDVECVHDREAAFRNAKEGKACEWFFHITHNGGTTLTDLARTSGKTIDRETNMLVSQDTACSAAGSTLFKQYQEHMIPHALDASVPCTRDDFVSIMIVRDPLGRILSHDTMWQTRPENNFAHLDKCQADNYGLRKLIGKPVKDGPVTMEDVEFAKRRLRSFDVIIDMNDYSKSAMQLCENLGWSKCAVEQKNHKDPRDIMPAAIYEELSRKNQPEIAFYEYARQLAAERQHRNTAAFLRKKKHKEVRKAELASSVGQSHVGRQAESSDEQWVCDDI